VNEQHHYDESSLGESKVIHRNTENASRDRKTAENIAKAFAKIRNKITELTHLSSLDILLRNVTMFERYQSNDEALKVSTI